MDDDDAAATFFAQAFPDLDPATIAQAVRRARAEGRSNWEGELTAELQTLQVIDREERVRRDARIRASETSSSSSKPAPSFLRVLKEGRAPAHTPRAPPARRRQHQKQHRAWWPRVSESNVAHVLLARYRRPQPIPIRDAAAIDHKVRDRAFARSLVPSLRRPSLANLTNSPLI